jgi:heat shock protein HslJ
MTETTPSTRPDALEGVAWHLTSGVAIPAGVIVSARFVDGTVAGQGPVNRYRAPYELDGDRLRIGPATTTRMAGPPEAMHAERGFLLLLEATAAYRIADDGRTLALFDGEGDDTLWFAAAPDIADGLVGRWDVRFVRRGEALVSPTAGSEPWLAFDGAGRVEGHAGINRLHGPARVDGDRLYLGPLDITREVGSPERLDDEEALLAALDHVAGVRIDGNELSLLDADGETRLQLARAADDAPG